MNLPLNQFPEKWRSNPVADHTRSWPLSLSYPLPLSLFSSRPCKWLNSDVKIPLPSSASTSSSVSSFYRGRPSSREHHPASSRQRLQVTRNTTLVCKLHAVESKCACRSEGRQWGTRQWTKVSRSACVCIFFKQYICTGPPNLPQKRGLTSHLTPSSTEIPPGRAFGRGSHSISVAKAVDFIRIPSTFFPNWRNFFLTKYFVFSIWISTVIVIVHETFYLRDDLVPFACYRQAKRN